MKERLRLRDRLRDWLFPELGKDLIEIAKKREEISLSLLSGSRTFVLDSKRDIQGELAALYFTFPGRKQIPVKAAFRELLDYLDLKMTLTSVGDESKILIEKK